MFSIIHYIFQDIIINNHIVIFNNLRTILFISCYLLIYGNYKKNCYLKAFNYVLYAYSFYRYPLITFSFVQSVKLFISFNYFIILIFYLKFYNMISFLYSMIKSYLKINFRKEIHLRYNGNESEDNRKLNNNNNNLQYKFNNRFIFYYNQFIFLSNPFINLWNLNNTSVNMVTNNYYYKLINIYISNSQFNEIFVLNFLHSKNKEEKNNNQMKNTEEISKKNIFYGQEEEKNNIELDSDSKSIPSKLNNSEQFYNNDELIKLYLHKFSFLINILTLWNKKLIIIQIFSLYFIYILCHHNSLLLKLVNDFYDMIWFSSPIFYPLLEDTIKIKVNHKKKENKFKSSIHASNTTFISSLKFYFKSFQDEFDDSYYSLLAILLILANYNNIEKYLYFFSDFGYFGFIFTTFIYCFLTKKLLTATESNHNIKSTYN